MRSWSRAITRLSPRFWMLVVLSAIATTTPAAAQSYEPAHQTPAQPASESRAAVMDAFFGPLSVDISEHESRLESPPRETFGGERISAGVPSTFADYPWSVAIFADEADGTRTGCSGAILRRDQILTTARCVEGSTANPWVINVVAGPAPGGGSTNQSAAPKNLSIPRLRRAGELGFNLAILELSEPFTLGPNVQTIPIATAAEVAAATTAVMTGFGPNVDGGSTIDRYRAANLPLIDDATCNAALVAHLLSQGVSPANASGPFVQPTELCAGSSAPVCGLFDLGGPLVIDPNTAPKLVGLASYGPECAAPAPSVFLDLSSRPLYDFVAQRTAEVSLYTPVSPQRLFDTRDPQLSPMPELVPVTPETVVLCPPTAELIDDMCVRRTEVGEPTDTFVETTAPRCPATFVLVSAAVCQGLGTAESVPVEITLDGWECAEPDWELIDFVADFKCIDEADLLQRATPIVVYSCPATFTIEFGSAPSLCYRGSLGGQTAQPTTQTQFTCLSNAEPVAGTAGESLLCQLVRQETFEPRSVLACPVWSQMATATPVTCEGPATRPLKGGETINVSLLNVITSPTVSAVVLNVTGTQARREGFVTVYPTGEDRPLTSSLNLRKGQTAPNMVIVPVDEGGDLSFFSSGGTHLLADVVGYFEPATTDAAGEPLIHGSVLRSIAPTRLFDTRTAASPSGLVPARSTLEVPVLGQAGVPTAGVTAVVMNLTGTESTGSGFVTAFPSGTERPLASVLNFERPNDTTANLTILPVGANGSISLYTSTKAHLLGDVVGYMTSSDNDMSWYEGAFVPVPPSRVFDTRSQPAPTGRLSRGGTIQVPHTGVAAIPNTTVGAVSLNLTATNTAPGFVTVFPGGQGRPLASNLNISVPGETRANAAIMPVGNDGGLGYFSSGGADLLADANGFFITLN